MSELQELLDACIRKKVFLCLDEDDLERLKQCADKLNPATEKLLVSKLKQILDRRTQ